jgi:predicted nucleic acid-binding protein
VFVDSGAWIALIRANDRNHAAADQLFRDAHSRRVPLITSNLVVAEVHRFFLFRANPKTALAVVRRMCASSLLRVVFCTGEHHAAAVDWLERFADQTITYTDATSFAVMTAEGAKHFLGYDRDFEIAGFTRWSPEDE